jgi:hypothetical protein
MNCSSVLAGICATRKHPFTSPLVAVIALESILFLGIGLWRFSREEFY